MFLFILFFSHGLFHCLKKQKSGIVFFSMETEETHVQVHKNRKQLKEEVKNELEVYL